MYNGVREVILDDEKLAAFYESRLSFDLLTNQYLTIKNINNEYIDKYKFDGEKLIKVKPRPIDNQYLGKIKPLNIKQECYFDLLESNIPLKAITGGFGVGKSFISTAWALQEIQKGKYNKLVVVRNNVDVADVPSIGAIPGDETDKLKAHCAFVGDIVSDYIFDMLLQQNKIEIAYLGTIRGRSFTDCVILVNEAQNLTTPHVKLLVSRVAKNSTIIFDFDMQQTDKKTFKDNNGMLAMVESLKGHKLFGMIELDKVERSDVASLADLIN